MYYAHHIGSEIGRASMRGRGVRAALGWRCRHLRPRELQVLAAALKVVRRWLHRGFRGAQAGRALATFDEQLSPG
jgi:hypothetical protein